MPPIGYVCHYCMVIFKTKDERDAHQDKCQAMIYDYAAAASTVFRCRICKVQFGSPSDLYEHHLSHALN
ncbi:hypothetical protein IWW52_000187 [Coemansia sp. RSA 2704]|nr:hypothetical protein IWW52_000187 [Coemansia sp. RSA 2704]